ncbi:MAG: sugar ABC transporter permease [Clostridia bacterium]|nr:sugar ABC transporter permease [Clostridia bacterium]
MAKKNNVRLCGTSIASNGGKSYAAVPVKVKDKSIAYSDEELKSLATSILKANQDYANEIIDSDFTVTVNETVEEPIVEEAPAIEEIAEEVVEEAPAIEEVAEEVVEEPVVEEIAEEVIDEEPVIEEVTEEVIDEPVIEEVAEEVIDEAPVIEEVAEETIEEPVIEDVAEEVVEETPAIEEIAEEVVEEAPAIEEIAEEVVEESVIEEVAEEVVEEPVVEEIAEEVVEEAPVVEEIAEEVVEEAPVIEEVAEEVVEESVIEEVAEEVVEESVIEEVAEEVIEEPVIEDVAEEVVEEAPVVEEIAEEVIEETPVIEDVAEETIEEPPVIEETEMVDESPLAEEQGEEMADESPLANEQTEEIVEEEPTTVAPIIEANTVVDEKGLVHLKRKKRGPSLTTKKALSGWLFVLPFIIGIIFIYAPIVIDSVMYSFSSNSSVLQGEGLENVGFDNYKELFNPTDPAIASMQFTTSLIHGFRDLVIQIPAIVIFALFMAIILNQNMKGRGFFRAIFFLPVILGAGIIDQLQTTSNFLQNAEGMAGSGMDGGAGEATGGGIVSSLDVEMLLSNIKLGTELVDIVTMLINSIFDIVSRSGVQMLIFLSGLQSISPAIYESCQVEGATAWETFWKITLPMISPMILVNAIYTIIDMFTAADNRVMKAITQMLNGSGNMAQSPGLGAAMGWTYIGVILVVIVAIALILKSVVFYQRRD